MEKKIFELVIVPWWYDGFAECIDIIQAETRQFFKSGLIFLRVQSGKSFIPLRRGNNFIKPIFFSQMHLHYRETPIK